MDYKYINQLLDRYWKAETSLEEEEILRAFFSQDELPAELKPYQALFSYEMGEAKQETLGDDFDQKMMAMIEDEYTKEPNKAKVVSLTEREASLQGCCRGSHRLDLGQRGPGSIPERCR